MYSSFTSSFLMSTRASLLVKRNIRRRRWICKFSEALRKDDIQIPKNALRSANCWIDILRISDGARNRIGSGGPDKLVHIPNYSISSHSKGSQQKQMDHEWGHGPMAPASPVPAQYLVPTNKSCAHYTAYIISMTCDYNMHVNLEY